MKNEPDHIDPELCLAIKKNYENTQIVVISNNKTLRMNIKKVLTEIGFNLSNIGIVDDYQTGLIVTAEHVPAIIICSLQKEEKHDFVEVLDLHKRLLPNRYKNLFFLMSESQSGYIDNYKSDFDFKDVFSKTQNYSNLLSFFTKNFKEALSFTKEKLLLSKINELINNNEYDKVTSIITTIDQTYLSETAKDELQAKIALKKLDFNGALPFLERQYLLDNKSYSNLISLIRINFELRKYDLAFNYIKKFSKSYECSPKDIPQFLKVFLFNKDYLSVIRFCSKYITDDQIDATTKLNMSAALALAGKNLINEKPNLAKESLELSLSMTGGSSFNILSMIVNSVLDSTKDYDYACVLLEQYKSNFINHQHYPILYFEVTRSKLQPNEVLTQTTKLLNDGFKSKTIYESLINASITIGRKTESVENIIFEACKTFPENCDFFKNLLSNNPA